MTLETPKYNLSEFPSVYEPSQDTFLFLDALELEIIFLQSLKPTFCVEIGCGSGVLSSALANILGNVTFATDINFNACQATVKTSKLNQQCVEVCTMDLLSQFRSNLFDIILFNPPYVPTIDSEINEGGFGIHRAWAGGLRGRNVTDRLLNNLRNLLSDSGVLYLLLLKENEVNSVQDLMRKTGFQSTVVLERKIVGEHLYVVKFFRS